ncbi:MAG: hypothetical protein AAF654_10125 [Myxococcota bacterium]
MTFGIMHFTVQQAGVYVQYAIADELWVQGGQNSPTLAPSIHTCVQV